MHAARSPTPSNATAIPDPSESHASTSGTVAGLAVGVGQELGDGTDSLASPAHGPVVTIGDSIMAGYGLATGQDWPTLLSAADDVPVTNLGCSGAGFIAVGDCGTDFEGLIGSAVTQSPSLIIVEGSDNDQGQTSEEIARATLHTVQELHAAVPTAQIIGLSTLGDSPDDDPDEITASSAAVQAAVASVGGRYLDIGQPLRGQADLLQSDQEHPTIDGQRVLLQTVSQALADAGISL